MLQFYRSQKNKRYLLLYLCRLHINYSGPSSSDCKINLSFGVFFRDWWDCRFLLWFIYKRKRIYRQVSWLSRKWFFFTCGNFRNLRYSIQLALAVFVSPSPLAFDDSPSPVESFLEDAFVPPFSFGILAFLDQFPLPETMDFCTNSFKTHFLLYKE